MVNVQVLYFSKARNEGKPFPEDNADNAVFIFMRECLRTTPEGYSSPESSVQETSLGDLSYRKHTEVLPCASLVCCVNKNLLTQHNDFRNG